MKTKQTITLKNKPATLDQNHIPEVGNYYLHNEGWLYKLVEGFDGNTSKEVYFLFNLDDNTPYSYIKDDIKKVFCGNYQMFTPISKVDVQASV